MKQYVCIKTVEAMKISAAVKNEAGDWTVFGEGELHNIPSEQAKNFKLNKKSPGYLIRYGNGKVEHMTNAKFTATYGELVNGVYDGVFEDAIAKADDEAPHVDENLTQSNKRELEKTRKRSARVESDFVDPPVVLTDQDKANVAEDRENIGAAGYVPASFRKNDYTQPGEVKVVQNPPPMQMPRMMQPQRPPNGFVPNPNMPKTFKPVHDADDKVDQSYIDSLRNAPDATLNATTKLEQQRLDVEPEELTYEDALTHLKMGNRLARRTWGHNRFIYLNRGGRMSRVLEPLRSLFGDKVSFFTNPRFDFYNGSQYVSVYQCSIDDQLARDWVVV